MVDVLKRMHAMELKVDCDFDDDDHNCVAPINLHVKNALYD